MPKDTRSGKGGKSNKTARVLSLLTDPGSAEEEKAEPAAQKKKEERSARAISDETTQAQIHDALESELLSSLGPEPPKPAAPASEAIQTPVPAPEAAQTPAPAPEAAQTPVPAPEAVQAPVPAPEAAQTPAPAPEAVQTPAPAPEAAQTPAPAPEDDDPDNYTCLNVTEALVEEKADKYIRMFGMCTCKRCRIDVIAMALSNLPAKYVVVKNEDINPRLSYYEQKYNAAVITQVMGACKKVLERPHHKR